MAFLGSDPTQDELGPGWFRYQPLTGEVHIWYGSIGRDYHILAVAIAGKQFPAGVFGYDLRTWEEFELATAGWNSGGWW